MKRTHTSGSRIATVEQLEQRTLLSFVGGLPGFGSFGPGAAIDGGDDAGPQSLFEGVDVSSPKLATGLVLRGEFTLDPFAGRYVSRGPVDFGMGSFADASRFVPLLRANGSVWYDHGRVLNAEEGLFERLWTEGDGEFSQALFTGSFRLAFSSLTTSSVSATGRMALAGAGFVPLSLTFVNPGGGDPGDSELRLGGIVELPAAAGGGELVLGAGTHLTFGAGGSVRLEGTAGTAGDEVAVGGVRFELTAPASIVLAGDGVRLGGEFTMPQWAGAAGTFGAARVVVGGTTAAPSVRLAGVVALPDAAIGGNWRVGNAYLSAPQGVVSGTASLYRGGDLIGAGALRADHAGLRFVVESGPGYETGLIGLRLDVRRAEFIGDASPGSGGAWEPVVLIDGFLNVPEAITGQVLEGGAMLFPLSGFEVSAAGYRVQESFIAVAGEWRVERFRIGGFVAEPAYLVDPWLTLNIGEGWTGPGAGEQGYANLQLTVVMSAVGNLRVGLRDMVQTTNGPTPGGHLRIDATGWEYNGVMPAEGDLVIDDTGAWKLRGLVFDKLSGPNVRPRPVTLIPGYGNGIGMTATITANRLVAITFNPGQSGPTFTFGGMQLKITHLSFTSDRDLTDNGGRPNNDPELRIAGEMTLSGPVSGDFVQGVPPTPPNMALKFTIPNEDGRRLLVNSEGVTLQAASLSAQGTWKVKFFGAVVVVVTDPGMVYTRLDDGQGNRLDSFKFTGVFAFPQFNNARFEFADAENNYIKIYQEIPDGETSPVAKAEMVGKLVLPAGDDAFIRITEDGRWAIVEAELRFDTAASEYSGAAKLRAGTAADGQTNNRIAIIGTYKARQGSDGLTGLVTLRLDGNPVTFKLFGGTAEFDFLDFTSDVNEGDDRDWDPRLRFAGSYLLPRQLTGPQDVRFSILQNNPLTVTRTGVSGTFQLSPVGFKFLNVAQVDLDESQLMVDSQNEFLKLTTTAYFGVLNGSRPGQNMVAFGGLDEQNRPRYIKISRGGVEIAGTISLPGPLTIYNPGAQADRWTINDLLINFRTPTLNNQGEPNNDGFFEGQLILRTPERDFETAFSIVQQTGGAAVFTVEVAADPAVPVFKLMGIQAEISFLRFTSDRNPGAGSDWDPEVQVAGLLILPNTFATNPDARVIVEIRREDNLTINASGVQADGLTLLLPGNQTFIVIGLLEIRTENVQIRFNLGGEDKEAVITGIFRVPRIGTALGAALDVSQAAGRFLKIKYTPGTGEFDYAANALATLANLQIFGAYRLQNFNLLVERTYGGAVNRAQGTARLVTTGSNIDFAVKAENGYLTRIETTFNNPIPSFTLFGITAKVTKFAIVPDRSGGNPPSWDPQFEAQGSLDFGPKLGNAGVAFAGNNWIYINSAGVSMTGVEITFPNIDFKLFNLIWVKSTGMKFQYQDNANPAQRYIKLNGALKFTAFTTAGVEFNFADPNYIKMVGLGTADQRIEIVGSVSLTGWTVRGFGLEEATLSFSLNVPGQPDRVTGSVMLVLPFRPPPNQIRVRGDLSFLGGYVDYISLVVSNLNVPIIFGPPPAAVPIVYLDTVGGAVSNISPRSTGEVTIGGDLAFTAGPTVGPYDLGIFGSFPQVRLAKVEINTRPLPPPPAEFRGFTKSKAAGRGTITIISPQFVQMTAYGLIDWSGNPKVVSANGSINVFGDFMTGTGRARATLGFSSGALYANFSASGDGTLRIPSGIADYAPYGTGWLARRVAGTPLLGGTARMSIDTRNPSAGFAGGYTTFSIPKPWSGSWDYVVGAKVTLAPSISFITSESDLPRGLTLDPDSEVFIVEPGAERATFIAEWDGSPDADFEIVDPLGNVYTRATFENEVAGRGIGIDENGLMVLIVENPLAGEWTLRLTGSDLGVVELFGSAPASPPALSVTGPALDTFSGVVPISYEVSNIGADPNASISFYYTPEFGSPDGFFIASVPGADGAGVYHWDTSGLPAGEYYVFVEADNNKAGVVQRYAAGKVTVLDPEAPAPVENVRASFIGDDALRVSWDEVAGAVSYRVLVTERAAVEGYTRTYSIDDATEAVIGELVAGQTYRITVAAVDEEGRIGGFAVPVVGIVGDSPTVPPEPGDWSVFADPGSLYSETVELLPGFAYTMVTGPSGSAFDGETGEFTWLVPPEQAGWSSVVIIGASAGGDLVSIRRVLLSDAERWTLYGGQVFEDADGNGTRDAGEIGINGITVQLIDPWTFAVLRETETGDIDLDESGDIDPETESGLYRFTDVAPGRYIIRLGETTGYIIIAPEGGEHERELARGESDVMLDFALQQARRPGPMLPPDSWWAGSLGADSVPGFTPPRISGKRAPAEAPLRHAASVFDLDDSLLSLAAGRLAIDRLR